VTGRESFSVQTASGQLTGWVAGDGAPVLLLHGGPGLSYEYLDGLAAELGEGFRVAGFQQRGLEPSTTEGPFTMAQAIDDVIAVLDGLGWAQALVAGHSSGGHLALRLAAAHPERLLGALAIDPIGVVGDGGTAAFEAEMAARTPEERRERAQQLDERAMSGEGTAEDGIEGLAIMWSAYFGDPENVPPMPPMRMSVEAYSGLAEEMAEGTDEVARELAAADVRYGVIAGGASPIPWGQAARTTVELSPDAFLIVVPGAGHFVWLEAPGSVREALQRLAG
jgi:pimeloyl-ACP methyl ester carboxylesterase